MNKLEQSLVEVEPLRLNDLLNLWFRLMRGLSLIKNTNDNRNAAINA
jgi:hypothetical protein